MSIPSVVTARRQTFNKLSLSWDVEPKCRSLWTKWARSRCCLAWTAPASFQAGAQCNERAPRLEHAASWNIRELEFVWNRLCLELLVICRVRTPHWRCEC